MYLDSEVIEKGSPRSVVILIQLRDQLECI